MKVSLHVGDKMERNGDRLTCLEKIQGGILRTACGKMEFETRSIVTMQDLQERHGGSPTFQARDDVQDP